MVAPQGVADGDGRGGGTEPSHEPAASHCAAMRRASSPARLSGLSAFELTAERAGRVNHTIAAPRAAPRLLELACEGISGARQLAAGPVSAIELQRHAFLSARCTPLHPMRVIFA